MTHMRACEAVFDSFCCCFSVLWGRTFHPESNGRCEQRLLSLFRIHGSESGFPWSFDQRAENESEKEVVRNILMGLDNKCGRTRNLEISVRDLLSLNFEWSQRRGNPRGNWWFGVVANVKVFQTIHLPSTGHEDDGLELPRAWYGQGDFIQIYPISNPFSTQLKSNWIELGNLKFGIVTLHIGKRRKSGIPRSILDLARFLLAVLEGFQFQHFLLGD